MAHKRVSSDLWRAIAERLGSKEALCLCHADRLLYSALGEGFWRQIFRKRASAVLELASDWQRHQSSYDYYASVDRVEGQPYKRAVLWEAALSESKNRAPHLAELYALEGFELALERRHRTGNRFRAAYAAFGGHAKLFLSLGGCVNDETFLWLETSAVGEEEFIRRIRGLLRVMRETEQKGCWKRIPPVIGRAGHCRELVEEFLTAVDLDPPPLAAQQLLIARPDPSLFDLFEEKGAIDSSVVRALLRERSDASHGLWLRLIDWLDKAALDPETKLELLSNLLSEPLERGSRRDLRSRLKASLMAALAQID